MKVRGFLARDAQVAVSVVAEANLPAVKVRYRLESAGRVVGKVYRAAECVDHLGETILVVDEFHRVPESVDLASHPTFGVEVRLEAVTIA